MPQISSELRLLFKIYSHSGMGTKCEHLYDGSGKVRCQELRVTAISSERDLGDRKRAPDCVTQ